MAIVHAVSHCKTARIVLYLEALVYILIRECPTIPGGSSLEHAFQSNPLRKGLFDNGMAPSVIVIFGATGDLTQRKLLPALYSLFAEDPSLRNMLTIIGAARRPWTQEAFTTFAEEGIKQNARVPFPLNSGSHFPRC